MQRYDSAEERGQGACGVTLTALLEYLLQLLRFDNDCIAVLAMENVVNGWQSQVVVVFDVHAIIYLGICGLVWNLLRRRGWQLHRATGRTDDTDVSRGVQGDVSPLAVSRGERKVDS